jgi:GAF domain-containing protein
MAAMNDQTVMIRVLSDFARLLVRDYAISDALHDLVEGATTALGIAGAAVSLARDGTIAYATASPELIAAVERVQEATQAGPCIDAHRRGHPVLVPDLTAEPQRWPALTEAATAAGLVAVAGIPMRLNGTKLGVLDLYDSTRRDWTDEDVNLAGLLAAMATAYVANAHRLNEVRQTAEQLQEALDSRVIIEQAKGVLAGERGISVDKAFELLRSHARKHQVSLRSVADGVVNLRLKV